MLLYQSNKELLSKLKAEEDAKLYLEALNNTVTAESAALEAELTKLRARIEELETVSLQTTGMRTFLLPRH